MKALTNPYTPNAGAEPQVIVGRDDQLESFDLLLGRLERGRTEQSMIITGLRGVGKTVLLGQFRDKAESADWVVVELEMSKHDQREFRRSLAMRMRTALLQLSPKARWGRRMRQAAAVLKSFQLSVDSDGTLTAGLDVERAEGLADHGDLQLDLLDLFTAVGEAAAEERGGKGVVLLFDEVQFLGRDQLEALIVSLHKMVQRKLPVTMVGAGLPQIAELAGDAKSYAERLFTFPTIGNLDPASAARALDEPARQEHAYFRDEALTVAYELTSGYPYFIQELGHAVWTVAEGPEITAQDVADAAVAYRDKLDSSFFRVRTDRTTPLQLAYLRAMAELGPDPQKAQDVARLLDRTSSQVGPIRAELIEMGLLYTPRHGYAAFTVPHFDEYMRRTVPHLEVPERRPTRHRGRR